MTDIGSLQVRIGADTKGLEDGLGKARTSLSSLAGFAGTSAKALAALGVSAVAAGKALAIVLTKQGLAAADAQAKMARSMDASADGLRGLQIAAERAGVSTGALNSAAQTMSRELARASRDGAGPAADALKRMQLNAADLLKLDVDERMATIADRAAEMGMSAGDASDVMRDLGIRSRDMAVLMIDGGDAIRQARQDVDDFGLSLSAVDAANIERANDKFADVVRLVDVLRQRLAAALAPVIEMVSNRIIGAARETGGFRDAIDRAIGFGVRAFAQIVNAVDVLRRVFVVVTETQRMFMHGLVNMSASAATALIDGPIAAVNFLISQLNRVPGINIEQIAPPAVSERLREMADEAAMHIKESQKNIVAAFSEPLPGNAIVQGYQDAVDAANASSEQQIASIQGRNETLYDLGQERVEAVAEEEALLEEVDNSALQRRLDRLREALMSAEELERHRYQQRLQDLHLFHDAALIGEDEFRLKVEQVEAEHQSRMAALREQGAEQQIQTNAKLSASMFGQNKATALANAVLSARDAIVGAYAFGARKGGPKLGAAFAAAAGIAQFRQIAAMRSVSLSGGGGAVSAGGGGAGASVQETAPSAGGGSTQTLQVSGISPGDIFTGDAVRDLANRLLQFQRDGGRVVFAD